VCETAFSHLGLDWRRHVVVDEQLKRAAEPVPRIGNSARARSALAWSPSLDFRELVISLVEADRDALQRAEPN
jgi:GDPmannose 4,6-dehydratase